MKTFKGRYLAAVLLIAITAVVVHLLQYDSQYDDSAAVEAIKKIPLRIASWTGHDVHLDERIYKILDTRAIVHRTYRSDNGDGVFLSIVYYADAKVDFHGPEGCLGGSGIEAEKRVKTITIATIGGRQNVDIAEIVTDDNGDKALVYYFYKVGDFAGQNYIKMRMNVAKNKLTQGDASGSLIRVSTPINSVNSADAAATLVNFLSEVFPAIDQVL